MFFHSTHIRPEEAKKLIDSGEAVLLDVRTRPEFQEAHIPGAKLLPLGDMPNNFSAIPDKAKTYIVYCHSGSRSMMAKRIMQKAGYTNVQDLGSIMSWPYGYAK